jgi:hypothetical protein
VDCTGMSHTPLKGLTNFSSIAMLLAMMNPRGKSPKNPLNQLTDQAIDYAEALLFRGSTIGAPSLQKLLELYDPYSPYRNDLIQHLQRCTEYLIEMDALIRARARTFPKDHDRSVRQRSKARKSAGKSVS